MNRYSSGARGVAYALIAGAFAWLVLPSSGAFAQDNAAAAASATNAAPAEAANQSRRDRRRAAQAETAPAAQATATSAATPPAAPAAAAAPPASVAAASDEPATICKNIKPLGTRMAKRVCGTPEQWAALEKKTTDAASDDMRQVRTIGGVIATAPGPTSTP
jgi:hypothetical protein